MSPKQSKLRLFDVPPRLQRTNTQIIILFRSQDTYVRGNRVRVSRYLRQYFCSLPCSFPTILCSRQPKGSGSEICERKSEPGLKEEICFMNLEMSPQGRCVWEGNGTEKKEFVERGTWNVEQTRPDRGNNVGTRKKWKQTTSYYRSAGCIYPRNKGTRGP